MRKLINTVVMMMSAKQMRKLINNLVMMMIFAKQMRKLINTLPVMIFAKQMSKMLNTLLMMIFAKQNEPNDKHSSDDDGSREEGKGIDCRSIDMQLNIQSLYE